MHCKRPQAGQERRFPVVWDRTYHILRKEADARYINTRVALFLLFCVLEVLWNWIFGSDPIPWLYHWRWSPLPTGQR